MPALPRLPAAADPLPSSACVPAWLIAAADNWFAACCRLPYPPACLSAAAINLLCVAFVILGGLPKVRNVNYHPFAPFGQQGKRQGQRSMAQLVLCQDQGLCIQSRGAKCKDRAAPAPALPPLGSTGVFAGASMVFFSFIGFDTVATTAEEVRNPARDLPVSA